jgi:hypothetical protein
MSITQRSDAGYLKPGLGESLSITDTRLVKFHALSACGDISKTVPPYDWGAEAQVDWYEAMAEIGGEMRKVYGFSMRSMASGGAFHVAYYHATQQAFLEAHELAFGYFGGVFRLLRYDNLKSEENGNPPAIGDV